MIITLIAAIADNNAIGRHNELPWSLPDDLKFFKQTTLGKPVIMGRKTFDTLGKALPGRLNIVLSKNENIKLPKGTLHYKTLDEAIAHLEQMKGNEVLEEVFIIGGGEIFSLGMPLADRMFLTRVHTSITDADAFFPAIDHAHWKLVWEEQHEKNQKHQYNFTFQRYERTEL